jgi:uncharacterized protein (DUF1800 family)
MHFLDIHRSYKANPNENFARELLELYTLGVRNYTKKDVKEIARCYTGLHYENKDVYLQRAFRVEAQFDSGVKEILGKRGNFYPEDVFDIILEKRECADFIARKAVFFFLRAFRKASQENVVGCITSRIMITAVYWILCGIIKRRRIPS